MRDPRTVARDIPGVLDIIFPRLSGALVASLNKQMHAVNSVKAVPDGLVASSHLQASMLFELSMVHAEQVLAGTEPDWPECLRIASERQRKHFDAKIPDMLDARDISVAEWSSQNLVSIISMIRNNYPGHALVAAPRIPGLGWISSGNGDFSLSNCLIEVKHTDRNFVSGDFRQVLLYHTLKMSASIERGETYWTKCFLINPRRNATLELDFGQLIEAASGGLNQIEVHELLRSIAVSDFEGRR